MYIKPKLESQTLEIYNDMKNEITNKYYKSTEDFETYKSPYIKGDGYTESAIKLGKAEFDIFWKFKVSQAINTYNYIELSITNDLYIQLNYEDGVIADLVSQRNKEKVITDY